MHEECRFIQTQIEIMSYKIDWGAFKVGANFTLLVEILNKGEKTSYTGSPRHTFCSPSSGHY